MSSMSVSVPSDREPSGAAGVSSASSAVSAGSGLGRVDHDRPEAAGLVGQLHAVHAAAVVVVERAAPRPAWRPGRPRRAPRRWSARAPGRWIDSRSTTCQCRNDASSTNAEAGRRDEGLGGLAELVLGADDRAQLAHPRDALVALVPHERQPAAGLEHPRDLRQGPVEVEPVERLRRRPRRRTTRREPGSPRRMPATCGRRAAARSRTREHLLVGLGGVHVVAERDQRLGELAGAGARARAR